MILDDLGLYLQTQGLGTLGTTLFKGSVPLDTPEVSIVNSLIALLETPGLPPERVHDGPSASVDQPVIQVLVRGEPHGYEAARALSEDLYRTLDGLANITLQGTAYLWLLAMQPPFPLPWDALGRPVFVFHLRCAHARGLTAPPPPLQQSYGLDFVNQTSLTIPASVHHLGTDNLLVGVQGLGVPAPVLEPSSVTIHPTTYQVTVTFAVPTSGRLILAHSDQPGFALSFPADIVVPIPGTVHGLGTRDLLIQLYDNAVPAAQIQAGGITVHPTTFDVIVTFNVPQAGRVVLYAALPVAAASA